jgi:AbrB family looped-hinge helix DNA binding protein
MVYQTTLTKKGQIVIPKKVREMLGLKPAQKLTIEVSPDKKEVRLKPEPDIIDLAGKYKFKKTIPADKIRDEFLKKYAGRF